MSSNESSICLIKCLKNIYSYLPICFVFHLQAAFGSVWVQYTLWLHIALVILCLLKCLRRCKSILLFAYGNQFWLCKLNPPHRICRALVFFFPVSHLSVNITVHRAGYNTWKIQPLWITIISSLWLCDTTRLNSHGIGDYTATILWPFSICTICLIWKRL